MPEPTNVAILRTQTGRNSFDKRLADLVGELSVRSEEFRTRWAAHNVRRYYAAPKFSTIRSWENSSWPTKRWS